MQHVSPQTSSENCIIDPNGHYVGPTKLAAMYGVRAQSFRNWAKQGLIPYIKTPGGNHLYEYAAVSRMFSRHAKPVLVEHDPVKKEKILYARVSSAKQADDLERQKVDLQRTFPEYRIISDIGSGLNWKRRGFCRLMDMVLRSEVSEIVVARRDRLCRFGLELLESIFKHFGAKFVVLGSEFRTDHDNSRDEPNSELAEDLLAITTYFVAKTNGLRAQEKMRKRIAAGETINRRGGRPRKKAKKEEEGEDQPAEQGAPLPTTPDQTPTGSSQTLDRCLPMDLQSMCFE
jgi:putative resolvase